MVYITEKWIKVRLKFDIYSTTSTREDRKNKKKKARRLAGRPRYSTMQ